jgi:hypothetical protein
MSSKGGDFIRWKISNVLVAGRRVSGEAWGRDPAEAVRRFAARTAHDLRVDVAAAIAGAARDTLKKVEVLTSPKVSP